MFQKAVKSTCRDCGVAGGGDDDGGGDGDGGLPGVG